MGGAGRDLAVPPGRRAPVQQLERGGAASGAFAPAGRDLLGALVAVSGGLRRGGDALQTKGE
eukprot:7757376-Pyramimonas_sp.AAC.1